MKRLLIFSLFVMMMLVLSACGGAGASTPEASAKNWIEALFKADGETLRANMCRQQSLALSDDLIAQLAQGLSQAGSALDLSGLTYAYNGAGQVTIGGMVKITIAGQTVERSLGDLGLNTVPVVEEDNGWKVCLSLGG